MHAEEARLILENRRRALLRSWSSSQLEESELLGDRRPEWAELSASQRLADLVDRMGEREVGELREIVAALRRIGAGTWGRCERCGKAVPAMRLRALPETRFCAGCAEQPALESGTAALELDDERLVSEVGGAIRMLEETAWGTCWRCGADLEAPESRFCRECGALVGVEGRP